MENMQMSGIRIGAILFNKKSWHQPLLLGQVIHYLPTMKAQKTALTSIGCVQIWQE